jgi:hypothetical protein
MPLTPEDLEQIAARTLAHYDQRAQGPAMRALSRTTRRYIGAARAAALEAELATLAEEEDLTFHEDRRMAG